MTLIVTNDEGYAWELTKQRTPDDYHRLITSIKDDDRNQITNFILESIDDGKVFNIATKFGRSKMSWEGTPLIKLYEYSKQDVQVAAILLGYLVQGILMNDDRKWLCTKTDMTGRDFDTNSYWLSNQGNEEK